MSTRQRQQVSAIAKGVRTSPVVCDDLDCWVCRWSREKTIAVALNAMAETAKRTSEQPPDVASVIGNPPHEDGPRRFRLGDPVRFRPMVPKMQPQQVPALRYAKMADSEDFQGAIVSVEEWEKA